MTEHVNIADPQIHEPKGVAAASSGEVYVADGATSGVWTPLFQCADIEVYESDAVSVGSIGTTAQTFPFSNNGQSTGNVTPDSANNRITVTDAGKYFVSFTVSFSTNAVGDAGLYEFKIVNNGSTTGHAFARQMSGSSDTGSGACQGILSCVSGAHITVSVESDEGGNTDDITVYGADLVVVKVG